MKDLPLIAALEKSRGPTASPSASRATEGRLRSALLALGALLLLGACEPYFGGPNSSYCYGGSTLQSCDTEQDKRLQTFSVQPSRWQRESSTDRFTGVAFSVIRVDALEPIPNLIGKAVTPILVVKCNGTLDVYVDWFRYVSQNAQIGRIRIDHQAPVDVAFSLSTNHQATFFRAPSPLSTITNLFGADTLHVQIVPYGEGPLTTSFPVGNLANELQQMQGACGISLGGAPH